MSSPYRCHFPSPPIFSIKLPGRDKRENQWTARLCRKKGSSSAEKEQRAHFLHILDYSQ
jgi:hypothetical protein